MLCNNLTIAILGPGAIGVYLASKFHQNGYKTYLISKDVDVEVLSKVEYVIEENSSERYKYKPYIIPNLNFAPDYLFITTKFQHLDVALNKIPLNFIKNTTIVPFLNGFLHFEQIKRRLNTNVLVSMIGGIDARKAGHNLHVYTSNFEILLATENTSLFDKIETLSNAFIKIGLNSKIYKREKEVIWQKLARLSVVSSLTAASQENLGFIRRDPNWNLILLSLIEEVVKIACNDGFEMKYDDVLKKIEMMPDGLTTSLQRDVAKKIPSELDTIVGAVIHLGKKHHCNTKTFEYIYKCIKSKYNS